ncbi:MAG: HEAT repeat domain-containing protein [Cyclobacteriaceae bacterium]|nr:HEAT repeat domain-containing protein [Cyclobacteriaceae bacterium]
MEKEKFDALVTRFNDGTLSAGEMADLEKLIEQGVVDLTQLKDLELLDQHLAKVDMGRPSMRLDDTFYSSLAEEKRRARRSTFSFSFPEWNIFLPRLAWASALLVVGFLGGYWLTNRAASPDVKQLTQEVSELKEMMLLSLLEKESVSERLKAVSLTNDLDLASDRVTRALIKTLNEDANVNVRLAALDALKPYVSQDHVREELVRSITRQESPLVQVSLAELMVAIQEKKSVSELKKLLKSDKTPREVKSRIEESINTLI